MDPTAPNDNNGQNPPGPVQPGQFVVAGEDIQPSAAPPPQTPKVSLAGERQPDAAIPPSAAASAASQPDPTPFTQPGQGSPQVPGQQASSQAQQPPKAGGGGKPILILLAVLVLIAIIAAVVYFFVLPMMQKKETTNTTQEDIVETSPPPERAENDPGFGEIPESTTSSEGTGIPTDTTGAPVEDPTVDPLSAPAQ